MRLITKTATGLSNLLICDRADVTNPSSLETTPADIVTKLLSSRVASKPVPPWAGTVVLVSLFASVPAS